MLIVNLNFAAEQVAGLLRTAGYKTLLIKEIKWVSGFPDFCKPLIVSTLYIVLPNGSIKEANDFLSNKIKIKILKLLKQNQ